MKKLSVFYCGWGEHWKLGELAHSRQKLLFEYSAEALARKLELSPLHLKLRAEAYGRFPSYQHGLPGLIADSLPDGWGLVLMDRLFRKQGIDLRDLSPLDRLAFLGERSMGALSFEPPAPDFIQVRVLTLRETATSIRNFIKGNPIDILPQLVLMGGSPQGARPKVIVDYDSRTGNLSSRVSAAQNPWIFKFPAKGEHKEVCAVEMLYSQLAKRSGIDVSDCEYIDLGRELAAFGMRRFDRQGDNRILTHSLAGVLQADFRIPSSVDYVAFLRVTRLMTRDEREVAKAFRQCVFNVVFNNRDDHSKNFSFIFSRLGRWKLSPAYDLTFAGGPGGEHQMDICGEGREPTKSHLMQLAEKGGIKPKTAKNAINEVAEAASHYGALSKEWPIRTATRREIEKKIQQNLRRLLE